VCHATAAARASSLGAAVFFHAKGPLAPRLPPGLRASSACTPSRRRGSWPPCCAPAAARPVPSRPGPRPLARLPSARPAGLLRRTAACSPSPALAGWASPSSPWRPLAARRLASRTAPGEPGRAGLELFVRIATRVNAAFRLEPEQEPTVARLCRRLEGLPLALELAAAWVRHLGVEEIAAEVERDLDFLAGTRTGPERHRSLRAVFLHAWERLSPQEQGVLRRLSVFRGGASRVAALEVAQASAARAAAPLCRGGPAGGTRGGAARPGAARRALQRAAGAAGRGAAWQRAGRGARGAGGGAGERARGAGGGARHRGTAGAGAGAAGHRALEPAHQPGPGAGTGGGTRGGGGPAPPGGGALPVRGASPGPPPALARPGGLPPPGRGAGAGRLPGATGGGARLRGPVGGRRGGPTSPSRPARPEPWRGRPGSGASSPRQALTGSRR
jgi:hypothetical protein